MELPRRLGLRAEADVYAVATDIVSSIWRIFEKAVNPTFLPCFMQVLHDGLSDSKYRPCPLLVKYVEAGWLGRKAGRGFYDYRGETPMPTR